MDRACGSGGLFVQSATFVAARGSLTVVGTWDTSFAGRLVSGVAVEWPVFEYLQPTTPTITPTATTLTIHGRALRQPGFLMGERCSKIDSTSTATSE